MSQPNKPTFRELRSGAVSQNDPHAILDLLLALDRALVEFSMHLYNLPAHDRLIMREQNQHLHNAVRAQLPRRTIATKRCASKR